MQIHRKILLSLCFLFLLPSALISAANQNTTELRGAVSDQAGAFIVGALVELRGAQIYMTRTDAQGRYSFPSIVPGRYKLKVFAQGFAAFAKELDLHSQPDAPLDITLGILLADKIEVRGGGAEKASTEPANNLSGLTLSEEELHALPDDPDQLLRVLRLMAGGTGAGGSTVYVDGLPQGGGIPPKSAIRSIRINSDPFSAEFSEPGRSRIEIATKPGSDRFHGEATFYFVSSGRPFNMTTGRDNNGDTLFTDRPATVSADSPGAIVTRFGAFNPTPDAADAINPRNSALGPGQVNLNASLSKTFSLNLLAAPGQDSSAGNLTEAEAAEIYPIYLTFSVDVENVLNHTNLAGFNGVLASPFFGGANHALEARRILLGARLSFLSPVILLSYSLHRCL